MSTDVAYLVLRAAAQLTEDIHAGVVARGFTDVRPAHGFAFVRISRGDATVVELAAHLGVTKQAASQLVDHLVRTGYVRREPDPRDARAKLLRLTDRGRACTRAADAAAEETTRAWGEDATGVLREVLGRVVTTGGLRPVW